MGQGMSGTEFSKEAKGKMESSSEIDYKDGKEANYNSVPQCQIWRTPTGFMLSAGSLAGAFGAAFLDPTSLAASVNTLVNMAHCLGLFVPRDAEEFDFPSRFTAGASLVTTTWAICTPHSSEAFTAVLALAGSCSLLNMARVLAYEPRQGKGLVQLALLLPTAAGVGILSGPGLSPWHPILMTLGASTVTLGTSLQLTKSRPVVYKTLATIGSVELLAGFVVALVDNYLRQQSPFSSLHESLYAMAMVGLLTQIGFALPTMGSDKEPPKGMDVFHHIMTKANFLMTSSAVTTTFATKYGWAGPPTVACMMVCGGAAALLMTPMWEYTRAQELSL